MEHEQTLLARIVGLERALAESQAQNAALKSQLDAAERKAANAASLEGQVVLVQSPQHNAAIHRDLSDSTKVLAMSDPSGSKTASPSSVEQDALEWAAQYQRNHHTLWRFGR